MTTQHSNRSLARAATLVAQIVLFSTFVCSAGTPRYSQTLTLGGLWKHEKLRLFKARFPGSICGTPLDPKHVNRHTFDDPDNSEWLTCCVDDPKEVAIFSETKVLSRDHNCPVLLGFYQEHLVDIGLAVDATSVETVLPQFIRVYGRIHHVDTVYTDTVPVRFASWWYGDVTLEVSEELLRHNDFEIVPLPSDRSPNARIILLNLF
jgi:hypothetical protein